MNANEVDALVLRHFEEASGTLRDCPVNELNRGESTRRNYFIFKIDLAGSTDTLRSVRPAIYARIAHSYLSTVDRITQQHGAEEAQTEYHGDGVLALFPERGNAGTEVLRAAILSHYAVNKLRREAGITGLHPKVLLHFAPLVVAKIGPYNESHRVAIGVPIHLVSKTSALLPALECAIQYEGGSVTEYLGDGVLALFAVDDDDNASTIYAAHRAAKNCLGDTRSIVNDALGERYVLPPLRFGIGMALGKVVVSLMGIEGDSHAKAFGKCVWDATNLADGENEIKVDDFLYYA
jgi:class 3 adenylate cyclase